MANLDLVRDCVDSFAGHRLAGAHARASALAAQKARSFRERHA
jgi:hypothetical protein